MYSDVVMEKAAGIEPAEGKGVRNQLEKELHNMKEARGAKSDTDLSADDLKELIEIYKAKVYEVLGKPFPENPMDQLWGAVSAVFQSWMGKRAISYRRIENIPDEWGTAVNVQSMVFGNMGDTSATGVAFTRNPATGENYFFGEYLTNAQGEDVVAGIRTPKPINRTKPLPAGVNTTLEDEMPKLYKQLVGIRNKLEKHYKEMQDIEFTIQQGKLWMLQTRTGKRTAYAAIKIAVDMVQEKLIDQKTALMRISPDQLDQLLHPMFDPKAKKEVIAKGLPASPGAATGQAIFHADEAEALAKDGKKVILIRIETSPEDIGGMDAAQGILTARGGMTSHAAVVARGMGKCCVAGCGAININYKEKQFEVGGTVIKEGDWVSLNGSTGEVMKGQVPTINPEVSGDFGTVMKWADKIRRLKVRTNADTPKDAKVARDFGAEGIGLCRTEHMFFEGDRIKAVREMILSDDVAGRKNALAKLLPMQKGDFIGIFTAMKGLPVTIRLLDPPLHEFVPHEEPAQREMAAEMGVSLEKIQKKIDSLHEFNPMLGHRGCRLGIIYPEITEMQARAIIEAACELKKKGLKVVPEIMIPLISTVAELKNQVDLIREVAAETMKKYKVKIDYLVGTMIEIPRAALTADKVAEVAEFFSFGTNDLTQMTMGLSRDDAGKFLPAYVEMGILKNDPFQVLDQTGVGQLVEMGVKRGRKTNKTLKVGICGEHGGDPSSVEFCHRVGMNYVSCSPYRVPIARLGAAQAVVLER